MAQKRRRGKVNKSKPKKKKSSILVKLFKFLIFLIVLGAIVVGAYAASLWTTLPDINDETFWQAKQSTQIFDKNDEEIYSTGNSKWIDIKDEDGNMGVSKYYLKGIIDTEDSKFETHHGVDYFGMIKGVFQTLFTNSSRGGSTLTMQLAKLNYMGDWETIDENGQTQKQAHPLKYKATQMLLAIKIEKNYTKEEILDNYINTVYFGDGAGYGIANAAEYYFGKDPADLTIGESALLAGIPQSPNNYDPYVDIDAATARRDVVIGRLLDQGDISQDEYDEAVNTKIEDTLVEHTETEITEAQKNSDYIQLVYSQLYKEYGDIDEFNPSTADLKIYTNLDQDLQEKTYDTINTDQYVTFEQNTEVGTATIDTQTGAILAAGDGSDDDDQNYAYTNLRQPGSTSKPIVDYGPAIEFLEWSTHHKVTDKETSFEGKDGPEVNNWDDNYMGDLTLQKALAQSRNTTAVRTFKTVTEKVGVTKVKEFVEGLGLTENGELDKEFNQAYSIGGWQYGTTPVELAGAYAAFGNGGTYHAPSAIRYIEISQSSPLYSKYGDRQDLMDKGTTAMKESTAYMITQMLDPDNGDAEGIGATSRTEGLENESLKTGTTNWTDGVKGHAASDVRDKWVAGYTPDATTVVWTGFNTEDENTESINDTNHDSYNVYKSIMGAVRDSSESYLHDDEYVKPDDVVEAVLAPDVWPAKEDSSGKKYYYIKGSDDYKEIEKTSSSDEDNASVDTTTQTTDTTIAQPSNITLNFTTDAVEIGWEGSSRKYDVAIGGKDYKTVRSSQISIPLSDLASVDGCKTGYSLGVTAIDGSSKSATTPVTLEFDSTYFCTE